MTFADDRALRALQGYLLTPSAGERGDVASRTVDATLTAPSSIVIPSIQSNRDDMEDYLTRREELQTLLPPEGAPSVITVADGERALGGTYQGGGPGPYGGGRRNAGFVLTSVRESFQEKHQVYQTFDGYIFYAFGRAPSVYNFSGYIMNTKGTQGSIQFLRFYENHLRAERAARAGVPASVSYLQTTAMGFVIGVRIGHQADRPGTAEFSFDMILG